jgi:hypothetical protein
MKVYIGFLLVFVRTINSEALILILYLLVQAYSFDFCPVWISVN